jgi:hypothetical protein
MDTLSFPYHNKLVRNTKKHFIALYGANMKPKQPVIPTKLLKKLELNHNSTFSMFAMD